MEHTVHLMAYHFVKALGIPLLRQSPQQVHSSMEDEFDIDTSTEIEVSVKTHSNHKGSRRLTRRNTEKGKGSLY